MKTASTPHSAAARRVSCPTCGGDSIYASSNPYRPFCSERCKNIDLGAWASENFRVAVSNLPEDQPTEEPPRSSASH